MSYKVLYIDDDKKYLLETLRKWNGFEKKNKKSSYPPMEFAGLSFGNIKDDEQKKMYYVDNNNIDDQAKRNLSPQEQDKFEAKIFTGFLEKITKIQPDAILLDIHLGYPSFLNGGVVLNKGIRKYYPYMPVVIVTKQADDPDVRIGWKTYYLSSEGQLCFSDKDDPKIPYEDVCKLCSDAIDYRGIPIQQYETNVLDSRLPDIFWAFIQELINSPLFNENNKSYPIIFLHGVFGSGRRLFALWVNALLKRGRQVKEPFPGSLTEINCACLSTCFADDLDKMVYLKDIFQPSKGGILFLTGVDRVPDSMQEAFKKTVGEWKKDTCIIATTTDSKRIGLERLPKGIREIESCDDWVSKNENALHWLVENPNQSVRNSKMITEVIDLLHSNSIEEFEKKLEEENIGFHILDCSEFHYETTNHKAETDQLERDIPTTGNCILVLTYIGKLNYQDSATQQQFQEWVNSIRENVCMFISPIYDEPKAVLQLLGQYKEVEIIENQNQILDVLNTLDTSHGEVHYFPHNIRTGGLDFVKCIRDYYKKSTVLNFDCTFFCSPIPTVEKLENELIPSPPPPLLVLGNVDRVLDKYEEKFFDMVVAIKKSTKKIPLIMATVTESARIGLENLPNDSILEIKLPSLQERFKRECFPNKEIKRLLDKVFPDTEDFIKRLSAVKISQVCPAIGEYYIKRLADLLENNSPEANNFIETTSDDVRQEIFCISPKIRQCYMKLLTHSLDQKFPTVNGFIDIVPIKKEISKLPQERQIYDIKRLHSINKNKQHPNAYKHLQNYCDEIGIENNEESIKAYLAKNKKGTNQQGEVKDYRDPLNNNSRNIKKEMFFFNELCGNIMKRVCPIVSNALKDEIPVMNLDKSAMLLLAIQMHDWPKLIFDKSRGLYDLEEQFKEIVAYKEEHKKNSVVIREDIKMSRFAREAEEYVSKRNISNLIDKTDSSNKTRIFEVITRAYADNYARLERGEELPKFEVKKLMFELGGNEKMIVNLTKESTLIVQSARKVLGID